ncbi:hypothetical protein TanjilG_02965 [Lupinus angustifolius]|uniref:Pectinesterase inhibitor domain-containing protein n=1 Tax=Lupinus angustifolius TaxID=3871 RepID=A0A394DA70_LUPAN|nr:PREDICTED: uncharacterized protein LOC109337867 [Lupinus angustifolius]OIW20163.1 hypothetical protein TanjilG_02965 [Lupinus angustifolius]
MAYFSITPSVLSSLVLLFFLFVASSSASKVVDVKVICAQVQDPKLCLSVLNSKPGGAKGADLVTLAQYTINVARVKATNTVNLINILIAKSGSDPKAKEHYKICLTHFNKDEGALNDIDYVQELLKKGDYFGVGTAASAVLTDVDDCLTGEDPEDPPYPDKSNLPQYADVVQKIVEILLIISKYLTEK